jgi:hypothetical protein
MLVVGDFRPYEGAYYEYLDESSHAIYEVFYWNVLQQLSGLHKMQVLIHTGTPSSVRSAPGFANAHAHSAVSPHF